MRASVVGKRPISIVSLSSALAAITKLTAATFPRNPLHSIRDNIDVRQIFERQANPFAWADDIQPCITKSFLPRSIAHRDSLANQTAGEALTRKRE